MRRPGRAMPAMLVIGGCTTAAVDSPPLRGQAVREDKAGEQVGLATLTEQADSVRIEITGTGLPAGPKGLHIHAVATCDPPDLVSAAAHFNPTGQKHGGLNPDGAHAGGLPNLVVTPAGAAGFDATAKAVTLKPGVPGSLFGKGGTSLVLHVQVDDEKTDPTGYSGGRIACGVITRS